MELNIGTLKNREAKVIGNSYELDFSTDTFNNIIEITFYRFSEWLNNFHFDCVYNYELQYDCVNYKSSGIDVGLGWIRIEILFCEVD